MFVLSPLVVPYQEPSKSDMNGHAHRSHPYTIATPPSPPEPPPLIPPPSVPPQRSPPQKTVNTRVCWTALLLHPLALWSSFSPSSPASSSPCQPSDLLLPPPPPPASSFSSSP